MNKQEFVERLAERAGFTKKDARKAIDGAIELINQALASNEAVNIAGFGKFEPRARKASNRINPRTGEKFKVPAKVVPAFKPGRNLREIVDKKLKAVGQGDQLTVKRA
ncbi:MAG: HU family DNA-binding protein [Deltaproteobacteria bacterium]|nr:HU family DNA-binding protein [Deltaproteobacteria bacterium]